MLGIRDEADGDVVLAEEAIEPGLGAGMPVAVVPMRLPHLVQVGGSREDLDQHQPAVLLFGVRNCVRRAQDLVVLGQGHVEGAG